MGLGPGPRVLLRGVVGPTGTAAADVDGRQSPNKLGGSKARGGHRNTAELGQEAEQVTEPRAGLRARERPVKRNWTREEERQRQPLDSSDGGSGGLVRRFVSCVLFPLPRSASRALVHWAATGCEGRSQYCHRSGGPGSVLGCSLWKSGCRSGGNEVTACETTRAGWGLDQTPPRWYCIVN